MNKAFAVPNTTAGATTLKATVRQVGGDEVTRLPRVPLASDTEVVFEIADGEEILALSDGTDVNTLTEVNFVGGSEIQ